MMFFFSCQEDDTVSILAPSQDEVIISESQLATLIEEVGLDLIHCVDFDYPISFNAYRIDFQTLATIVVSNDQELLSVIENIIDNQDYLVSLNYPVVITFDNQQNIEVNNNDELLDVLSNLSQQCDPVFDCPDIQANIGDDCTTPGGDLGEITANCDCEPVFDCPAIQANIGDPCVIQNQQGTINANCDCQI